LRAPVGALLLVLAAAPIAGAAESALPSCTALVAPLQRDPSSVRAGAPLLGVDAIVEDVQGTQETRLCTGVARYRDGTGHITYSARWTGAKHSSVDVNAHETTALEAASRARSLRIRSHPRGESGTFSLDTEQPFCADAGFTKLAEAELRTGISFREAFYKEPDYRIFEMRANGYGSGVLANCVATLGTDAAKGAIFLGTNWAGLETARTYQFYILSPGPDGFNLKNRLWESGSE
jgi:hypothetical protein